MINSLQKLLSPLLIQQLKIKNNKLEPILELYGKAIKLLLILLDLIINFKVFIVKLFKKYSNLSNFIIENINLKIFVNIHVLVFVM
jgi:hypothetical protein